MRAPIVIHAVGEAGDWMIRPLKPGLEGFVRPRD